jgi:hypothetical protein
MGLLDDAIRDHLELKRLRGADPGEVAREQREALDPDLRNEPGEGGEELGTAVEELSAEDDRETLPVRATPAVTPTSTADPFMATQRVDSTDASSVAEETAELDMRSVLAEDEAAAAEADPADSVAAAGPRGDPPHLDDLNEDQLEWQVPGNSSVERPPGPGQGESAIREDGR